MAIVVLITALFGIDIAIEPASFRRGDESVHAILADAGRRRLLPDSRDEDVPLIWTYDRGCGLRTAPHRDAAPPGELVS
jgi:hypothetical protein